MMFSEVPQSDLPRGIVSYSVKQFGGSENDLREPFPPPKPIRNTGPKCEQQSGVYDVVLRNTAQDAISSVATREKCTVSLRESSTAPSASNFNIKETCNNRASSESEVQNNISNLQKLKSNLLMDHKYMLQCDKCGFRHGVCNLQLFFFNFYFF